jgi:hypothetical protein
MDDTKNWKSDSSSSSSEQSDWHFLFYYNLINKLWKRKTLIRNDWNIYETYFRILFYVNLYTWKWY